MAHQVYPLAALLLGSGFLLFAGGITGLVLTLRGAIEGFSPLSLGLLGTSWALGYVLGCLLVPRLVSRVGHVRSFSVMSAMASVAILGSLLVVDSWAWIAFRAVSGFCFAGAAMIVEGWLGDHSTDRTRGTVFGIYTTINLGATTAGQMSFAAGDPSGYFFFVFAAIFYTLALIPIAVSSSSTPLPLQQARLDLGGLYRNSPVAVVSSFFIGIANGAFSTLAAVYAQSRGFPVATIALFASLPILAGAVAQVPVGLVSDRMDRRVVLVATAILAVAVDAAFVLTVPEAAAMVALASLLGAAMFSMYPIIIAHANDHAHPDSYILTSGGLLLVFGLGAIIGPLLGGVAMQRLGDAGLFVITGVSHALIVIYAIWRILSRPPVPAAERSVFVPAPIARNMTPQTAALAQPAEDANAALDG